MKYDNALKKEDTFYYGADRYGGEAVFAPRLNANTEDDGYLISFVQDEAQDQSECVIIDAQDVTKGPVATIVMPCRVPYGFHAGWVGQSG
jgi:carotenoid cleavage dioxygenase